VKPFRFSIRHYCFQPGFSRIRNPFFDNFLLYTKPGFFQAINKDISKNLELLLHSSMSDSDNTEEVAVWCA